MIKRELIFLLPTLEKFASEREDIPARVAAKIAARLVRLRTVFEDVDKERQEIQKRLAVQVDGRPKIEDGRFVFEDQQAVADAINELFDEEVATPLPAAISVDSLPEEFELSSAVMAAFLTLGIFEDADA